MITNSLIVDGDVEAEREVILDEIAMHDDDPDDVVHNLWATQAYGETRLGRPIAGAEESIRSITRAQLGRFRSEEHTSELQSLMRISYAVFCLKKKKQTH